MEPVFYGRSERWKLKARVFPQHILECDQSKRTDRFRPALGWRSVARQRTGWQLPLLRRRSGNSLMLSTRCLEFRHGLRSRWTPLQFGFGPSHEGIDDQQAAEPVFQGDEQKARKAHAIG